jgi:hypothetical protein
VLVAVAKRTDGDRCRPLRSSGRLGSPRPCRPKAYLVATGRRVWRLQIGHRLPRGSYLVVVRAVDRKGNFEAPSGANQATLRVR